MMQHMMDGGMMWGMGVGGLIALVGQACACPSPLPRR
jgi:hypothetical protein